MDAPRDRPELSVVLSTLGAVRGPGGDVLVTRDLEGMYLLFVLGALLGAAVPLFRPGSPGGALPRQH